MVNFMLNNKVYNKEYIMNLLEFKGALHQFYMVNLWKQFYILWRSFLQKITLTL